MSHTLYSGGLSMNKLHLLILSTIMTSSFSYSSPLSIKNFEDEIKKAPVDSKVNIKVAPLAGDETMTMYSTVLKPEAKVTAHVHSQGIELYHILKGIGEMYTGSLIDSNKVKWNPPQLVKEGDVFSINPGIVHQLKNVSSQEDLILMFVCPHSHLKEDRMITDAFSKD